MSLWRKTFFTRHKSLPMSEYNNPLSVKHKEIPFCTRLKGSMTLEAAVILPLYAGFIVSILFFFRVLQIETEVAEALSYASRMTAVESSVVESEAAQLTSAELLFRKEVAQYSLIKEYVSINGQGITLLGSSAKGDYIKLCATYKIRLPIGFFGVSGFTQTQKSVSRKWTGKHINSEEDDPYVYYTETGKVYHLTKSCPYLDLSIQKVPLAEVSGLRNKSKRKYSGCRKCAKNLSGVIYVYITDYGVLYHKDISCSGLKRTIYTVRLSQVGERPPCSKCGKAGG